MRFRKIAEYNDPKPHPDAFHCKWGWLEEVTTDPQLFTMRKMTHNDVRSAAAELGVSTTLMLWVIDMLRDRLVPATVDDLIAASNRTALLTALERWRAWTEGPAEDHDYPFGDVPIADALLRAALEVTE